jgi:hypothetical protein
LVRVFCFNVKGKKSRVSFNQLFFNNLGSWQPRLSVATYSFVNLLFSVFKQNGEESFWARFV